ncbi:MAG: hypothetical protein ACKO87_09185 [Dolichospermum sp.]
MDQAIAEIRKLVNEYPEDTRFMVMLAEVFLFFQLAKFLLTVKRHWQILKLKFPAFLYCT